MSVRTLRSRPRTRFARRTSAGITLIEVLVTLAISGLVMAPLLAWGMLSIGQQAEVTRTNVDTSGMGLANVYFPRDVANASKAAVLTSGQISAGVTLPDCVGGTDGSETAGVVKVVIVSPANRLIVYKTTPAPSPDEEGDVMWRRECANESSSTAPTGSGLPDGLGGTALLTSVMVTQRIDTLDASCPSPTAGATGTVEDSSCWSVKLSARLLDRPNPVVLQASRRINTDTTPGSPPVAKITYLPAMPSTCSGLTLDASRSVDPFNEGFTSFSWTVTKFNVATGTWDAYLTLPGLTAASTTLAPSKFPTKGDYRIELTVTAGTPDTPQGPRTGSTGQVMSIGDCVPNSAIVGLWKGSTAGDSASNLFATGTTPTVMIGQAFTVKGELTSVDATPDSSLPDNGALRYEWQWGEADGTGAPLGSGQQTVTTANCPGSRITGQCNVTTTFAAGYSQLGVKQIQLFVTDAQGRTATYMRTVNVITNALYVSDGGSDSGTCGTAASPCKTLVQGLVAAKAQEKTILRLSAGKQGGTYTKYAYATAPLSTTNVAVPLTLDGRYEQTSSGSWVASGSNRPVITGPGGPQTTGLLVSGSINVTLDHLEIRSGTASTAGASAYGVRAVNQASVTIRDSTIIASAGVAGANGSTPSTTLTAGTGGTNGVNGVQHSVPGGAANGTGASDGGNGGNGDGSAGINGFAGGTGGAGGCNNCIVNPASWLIPKARYSGGGAAAGKAGSDGGPGANGGAGSFIPAFYDATYVAIPAAGGANGGNGGGGGGGGGGGRACDAGACAGERTGGGAGGGGGGGGQGGYGGTGGGAGGGSFAVYANNATVTVGAGTTLTTANGGAGGAGATGQAGALGGSGGNGGSGAKADNVTGTPGSGGSGGSGATSSSPATDGAGGTNGAAGTCCNASSGGGGGGGGGGKGGKGGTGGGGLGGPSVAMLSRGTGGITFSGDLAANVTIGAGGAGGDSAGGNAGAPGAASKSAVYP